jgi:hypothetical protein
MEICLLLPTTKTVISTEAVHGLIVSSAVEKSASLPKQHLSPCRRRRFCLFLFTFHKSTGAHPSRTLRWVRSHDAIALVFRCGRLTNPDQPEPKKQSSLTARQRGSTRTPGASTDLSQVIRRLCALFGGEGGYLPRKEEILKARASLPRRYSTSGKECPTPASPR